MTAMTNPRLTLTTAAVAAVAVLASASTALAAEAQKPAQTAAPRAVAPDAAAAARASKIAKTTSALGSYYDTDSGEQVVVAGRKSRLTEAAVDKAVGAPARLERLTITGATVDAIKDELAARDFSPSAKKYSYGGYLDLESGKFVLTTDAPAAGHRPAHRGPPRHRPPSRHRARHVPPPRRRPRRSGAARRS